MEPRVLLLNKPFGVICQFSPSPGHATLASCIDAPGLYPAGRLDADSEGLVVLTKDGTLQHRITTPGWGLEKVYWSQVEGTPGDEAIAALQHGIDLGDYVTRPAMARRIDEPSELWSRMPPIRYRANVPTGWLEIRLHEGKNRQVRRMTARVGYPTLRLIRVAVGPWLLEGLRPGESRWADVPSSVWRSRESERIRPPRPVHAPIPSTRSHKTRHRPS